MALLACALLPWPGYAVLHIFGAGRARWPGAILAGPAVTVALWTVVLSGAAWLAVPLERIGYAAWVATAAVGCLGLALRISVAQKVVVAHAGAVVLWIAITGVALCAMPTLFVFGFAIFANSTFPDAWSYIAVADYLTLIARGTEGGLSPLHQYASHLSFMRNASSALLAFIAKGIGSRADEAVGPFCFIVLFAYSSALAAFAKTVLKTTNAALLIVMIAGFGCPALVMYFANFDQLLLLPMPPLMAAIALRSSETETSALGNGAILGLLMAAAILAYIEIAPLAILVGLSFGLQKIGMPWANLRHSIVTTTVACFTAGLLVTPASASLLAVLRAQYLSSTNATRPGDGVLAAWLLGGEFLQMNWISVALITVLIGTGMIAIGVWSERTRWSVVFAFAVVVGLSLYFGFHEVYLYAVYKIVSVNAWLIGFFAVCGLSTMSGRISVARRSLALSAIVVCTAIIAFTVSITCSKFVQNALRQISHREALTIAATTLNTPILIAVNDNLANEWAVFYLANVPAAVVPYRGYMAQAHLLPVMARAKRVPRDDIRYVVTDHDDISRLQVSGATRIWDGTAYTLWKIEKNDWTVCPSTGCVTEAAATP